MKQLEQEIRTFIADNFVVIDEARLSGSDSLTRGGVIDSVGIVELMQFLESRYGIEILDDETVPDNFDSIDNIVRYLGSKIDRVQTGAYDARP